MSEGLTAKYLHNGKVKGQILDTYEYFNIGDVTFNQLSKEGLVPPNFSKEYSTKKPDRLFIRREGKKKVSVVAVVEDKDNGLFSSATERLGAIQQCNNYCQELNARMGIITDGKETIWINPHQPNAETEYLDEKAGKKRSYTFIRKEDESPVNLDFVVASKTDWPDAEQMPDDLRKVVKLVKTIAENINEGNSTVKEPERIDPLPLARSVWQDIWIATGKSPEKCLYNVVELFIFKFLSDLNILQGSYSFESLYKLVLNNDDPKDILRYYVNNCRKEIYRQFPAKKEGDDNTTIINGTIFVDEKGEANITQAVLFKESIKKFKFFEEQAGKFSTHNIDKDFKTKLYESFLKQTAGLKALGQYFTPRKVVRAVVNMSDIDNFGAGERVCDPFCGVGGFILEPLNLVKRAEDFKPKNGVINSPVYYKGYDKGFEKDEERTIILAKANMLIYLAEQIAESKKTEEFAKKAFNETFQLLRSNLGTLGLITHNEAEKFDLIITNPPYVKSGIKTLKNEIEHSSDLKNFYTVNGGGLEGLALEWIVKHLKKGGKSFIIAPDGIFHRSEDKKLRKFLLDECYLDGIISLPSRTFYATPKKTYILAITKKASKAEIQTHPVFTYLVSHIGETLDINRFETPEKNDLDNMVLLFNQFKNIKTSKEVGKILEGQSKLCKIQPISAFDPNRHWLIDRWWTKDEKVSLGIEEIDELVSYDEYVERLEEMRGFFDKSIHNLTADNPKGKEPTVYKDIQLKDLITVVRGDSRFTHKYVNEHPGEYPLYSAKTGDNGLMGMIDTADFNEECVTYTTNGAKAGTVFYREKHKFSLNGDAAMLKLNKEYIGKVDFKYLSIAVQTAFNAEGLGWEYKATNSKVEAVSIKMPVDVNGNLDLKGQQVLAEKHDKLDKLKKDISGYMALVSDVSVILDE